MNTTTETNIIEVISGLSTKVIVIISVSTGGGTILIFFVLFIGIRHQMKKKLLRIKLMSD
jgi:hypothetical protein